MTNNKRPPVLIVINIFLFLIDVVLFFNIFFILFTGLREKLNGYALFLSVLGILISGGISFLLARFTPGAYEEGK